MSMIFQYLWRGKTTDNKNRIVNNHRHKTRVLKDYKNLDITQQSFIWNYDGSSTMQATTQNSVVHLIPVMRYRHPNQTGFLLLCKTSLENDTIALAQEKLEYEFNNTKLMLGFELECFVYDKNEKLPIGMKDGQSQISDHYCGINSKVSPLLQKFLDEVLVTGLEMGISLTGHNIEVAYGQIELQVCDLAFKACCDLEVLKYLLTYIGQKPEYNFTINYDCKPLGSEHNGSGMHTNFSTHEMRSNNSKEITERIVEKLGKGHSEAMKIYGFDNELRLTGHHETSNYNIFSYAMNSRAVSVRLQSKYNPITKTIEPDYTYVEDRRPNSTADQFEVAMHIYDMII